MSERPEHPSGRPIRREPHKRLSIPRPPPYEPLTPGLRRASLANAIGFHRLQPAEDRDE